MYGIVSMSGGIWKRILRKVQHAPHAGKPTTERIAQEAVIRRGEDPVSCIHETSQDVHFVRLEGVGIGQCPEKPDLIEFEPDLVSVSALCTNRIALESER
ncbi:hypothetical protein [Sulfidibacter corallicola]|uniref:Uncharacterized protein n=1 Tax=Sulfidibacter corallicola TaxID=2818388 RepID=A0A8A4TVN6_SULCO|nr:hypothetical protein [Sulfidibacter corallicola]QTD50595.1 hypothetical protein J3U87_33845 [Sulfidibacter corallicola]